MSILKLLRRDQKGATAIEYGLIAALVAVGAAGVMGTLGTNVKTVFTTAGTKMDSAATTAAAN